MMKMKRGQMTLAWLHLWKGKPPQSPPPPPPAPTPFRDDCVFYLVGNLRVRLFISTRNSRFHWIPLKEDEAN